MCDASVSTLIWRHPPSPNLQVGSGGGETLWGKDCCFSPRKHNRVTRHGAQVELLRHFLTPPGSSWLLLAPPVSSWLRLASASSCFRLASPASPWPLLGPFMAPHAASCLLLPPPAPPGFCILLSQSGSSWLLLLLPPPSPYWSAPKAPYQPYFVT